MLLRSPAVLLCLAALAGCSTAPQVCHLQSAALLPARLDNRRLLVTGKVNGADTALLVDTGAEASLITTGMVDELQLPRSRRSVTRLGGVGGVVSNADVFADLDLGSISADRRFPVATVPDIGGLIGADILSSYDVDLDLPARRVQLWRAGGCDAAQLPLTGAFETVPMRVTGGGRVRLTMTVDGHAVTALLDSGDSQTLLKTEAAERIGISPAALASDPAVRARGVDGGAIGLHLHRFADLTVGDEHLRNEVIGVGDLELPDADMLLGVDYLRGRRVWISYRTGQLFIQPATAAHP